LTKQYARSLGGGPGPTELLVSMPRAPATQTHVASNKFQHSLDHAMHVGPVNGRV